VPADSASEIVKFTISIPRESCTNAKAKYSSSVVPPDSSVHFYHWVRLSDYVQSSNSIGVTNCMLLLQVKYMFQKFFKSAGLAHH